MITIRRAALIAATLIPALAGAEPPRMARYMPLYPGQYLDVDFSHDPGDRSFTAAGATVDTAAPAFPGQTALPRDELSATLSWHFPLLESYGIPLISDRTWVGRVSLHHTRTQTEGSLTEFINDTSDDAATDADDLRNNGGGLGDMSFELGTYLWGSPAPQWRERERTPFAVLLAGGFTANFGHYDRDAPTSAGHNTPSAHLMIGVHWQPWTHAFLDAGARHIEYFKNQDPAFGALAPTQQGDDLALDISLAQRLRPGWYLSVFGTNRDGDPNRYDAVRFAPNPPPPPPDGTDQFPTPGHYFDAGTALRSVGATLSWFVSQRLRLDLSYTAPVSGASGAIELPYTERTPAGCTLGAAGCTTAAGDTVVTDGYGPGRVLASDRVSLSLSFQFLERDTFNCRGCSQ